MSRNIVRTSVLSLILLLSFTLLLSETLAEPPSNFHDPDAGTEANPYLIANLANLRWLSETPEVWGTEYESFSFLQTADIDATETQHWNPRGVIDGVAQYTGFTSISLLRWNEEIEALEIIHFRGVYDGNGFAISGLYTSSGVGLGSLFGYINGATIKNVHLVDVRFFNGYLVFFSENSTILNCHVSGLIRSCTAAGIVAYATNSHIEYCSSTAHLFLRCAHLSYHPVGGLVYNLRASTLKNSYFHGSYAMIVAGGGSVVGLVGSSEGSVIQNCYVTVTEESPSLRHGLVRHIRPYYLNPTVPSVITNNFWDTTMTGALTAGGEITEHNFGLPTAQMQMASTFIEAGWDFENVWAIDPDINGGYPYHRSNTRLSPIASGTETTYPVAQSMRSVIYPNPVRTGDVTFRANVVKPQMEISIYNVKGQLVKKSTDFAMGNAESRFVWDRKNDKGQSVTPGVYLYRINAGDEVSVGKLLIIK